MYNKILVCLESKPKEVKGGICWELNRKPAARMMGIAQQDCAAGTVQRDCAMMQHGVGGSEHRSPCRRELYVARSAILPAGRSLHGIGPGRGFSCHDLPVKRRNGAVSARSRQVFGLAGHSGCRDLRKIRMQHRSPCCLKRRG